MNGATKKQAIHDRLATLAKNGRLTPDAVVADAAKKSSPLHGQFEWDDKVAGHRYRIEQARELIQGCKVYIERTSHVVTACAYVRDPDAEPREQGYRSTIELRDDREAARRALANEADRARAYLERLRNLSVALGLEDELSDVLQRFDVFRGAIVP